MHQPGVTIRHLVILLLLFAPGIHCQAATNVPATPLLHITTPQPEKSAREHGLYFVKLLTLAMEKTEPTDGPFIITQANGTYTSNRQINEVARDNGVINIMWTSTGKEREKTLLPVRVSILKGLNSYRVFLIRKEDQEKFHKIHNVKELSQLAGGQGAQWPDTQIMLDNGLPVVTAAQSDLLFEMLAGKRFDYFPRGLYEIWDEQKLHSDKGLVVEDSLMFHYPSPIYFFVNKKNAHLADRLERGLNMAMRDGSFDKLFFSVPSFKRGYDELHNSTRQLLELNTDFQAQD